MPITTISTNQNVSSGFTALESITIDGKESAVTLIINERIVPTPTPFANNASATGKPNAPISNINAPISTSGLEIRKLNVTPLEMPARVNPIKIGIDEQEQNGVTVPSNAPMAFAPIPLNLPSIFFVLSGGK